MVYWNGFIISLLNHARTSFVDFSKLMVWITIQPLWHKWIPNCFEPSSMIIADRMESYCTLLFESFDWIECDVSRLDWESLQRIWTTWLSANWSVLYGIIGNHNGRFDWTLLFRKAMIRNRWRASTSTMETNRQWHTLEYQHRRFTKTATCCHRCVSSQSLDHPKSFGRLFWFP